MPEDYLLRLFEQVTLMLAAIHDRRAAGRNDDAAGEIETACLHTIGLPFALIKRSSPEALSDLMQRGGERYFRSILLAELLLQEAELNKEAGKLTEMMRGQLQAFCLISESINVLSRDDQIIYRIKLKQLAKELEETCPDPYLLEKLKQHSQNYRQSG